MLITLDPEIQDRGSRYAVSGAQVTSKEEVSSVLKALKRNKKIAKATHNSWAVQFTSGPLKNDDGEAGAGMIILRMLQREELLDHLVIVTRWYGGKHLGGDRFRHVQACVAHFLKHQRGG